MAVLSLKISVWRYVIIALVLVTSLIKAEDNTLEPLCSICQCKGAVLNCKSKNLTVLPSEASLWPADVEEAHFAENDITHLKALPALPRLRLLCLRRNRIQKIDNAAFQNLTALEILDLSINQLSRLTLNGDVFKGQYDRNDFEPLGKVTELRLDSNSIHSLDSNVFEHIPYIKTLSLSSNPLRHLDNPTMSAIASLSHLEALDLSYTYLDQIPPALLHSPLHLHHLNLSGNAFTQVPEELAELHELKELRLSSNPIRNLEKNAFPYELHTLEVLEMNYMHNLSRVGAGAFQPLSSLRRLSLAHTIVLKEIDKYAFRGDSSAGNLSLPPLEELILRGNSLQSLDNELLNWWGRKLKYVDLQDNLWMCDCDLQWVVEVLEPMINDTHPELLRNIICENPEPMRGYSLFSLHARHYHLRCMDADDARPDRDTTILIGVLIGSLLAVPATLAAVLCWKRGGFSWLSGGYGGGAASFSRAFYRRTNNVEDF